MRLRRTDLVALASAICMHNKKVNLSQVFSGQKLGLNEVEDNVWLVSFMKYDLG